MVNRTKDYRGPETGNALKDGYTVIARRSRYTIPSDVPPPDRADEVDGVTDFMVEMGGASTARRRIRDFHDNDY